VGEDTAPYSIAKDDGRLIAIGQTQGGGETSANAALIAAAPDLLAALVDLEWRATEQARALVFEYESTDAEPTEDQAVALALLQDSAAAARAAIRKARGEE